ncbi:MAG TPA: hypothetical protein VFQ39_07295 [Longimicrobium sp.]|nr:hypothetical protein [Longimicrobium sp.]
MARKESQAQKVERVSRELGVAVKREAAGRWTAVRTGDREEKNGHAWRFRPTPGGDVRYLRVTHAAMVEGENPVAALLGHLSAANWLDRLDGADTSLVLHTGGRVVARA